MKTTSKVYYVNKHLLSAAAVLLLLSGCAGMEPWVKPYERDKLADPIMAFGRHPVALQHVAHVQDSREAAKGANGSGGGGCGCN
ncbi:MAG: DUF4266 domain-containing protein [Gammaproteobacteria bacterium HGW-Gammaproteobacteria-15]|nr:hypothetical protein AR688_14900 [Rheinheimera sp. EpRS3]PKM20967.1 MAG: DUF4266 domain-containing protein [Gammaproteobacteria bacterium HGW-Gammaproteobacteria-15]